MDNSKCTTEHVNVSHLSNEVQCEIEARFNKDKFLSIAYLRSSVIRYSLEGTKLGVAKSCNLPWKVQRYNVIKAKQMNLETTLIAISSTSNCLCHHSFAMSIHFQKAFFCSSL